jgi:integrase
MGQMGVVKRGNSKFWYIQFQLRGKTVIKSTRTTDKRAAEQMEREMRRQLHAVEYLGQKERITIHQALETFCEARKGTANHKNVVAQTRVLDRLLKTTRYLDELTSEDLERLKRDRFREGTGPATLKHTLNLIRGAWKYAQRMGYQVGELQFPQVKTPKSRLPYLSVAEEKALLRELDPKREGKRLQPYGERSDEMKRNQQDAYDLVVLLLDTGARYSEIANLEWSQIDLQEHTIRLWRPKVQNESILYMTHRIERVLIRRAERKDDRYVFTSRAGGPRGYACRAIRKAFRRAGLRDCTIHTLRHTHASRLVQNGMTVYEVKEILGHTDIKTTMRYAHLEQRDVSSRARDVINKLNKDIEKPDLKVV